MPPFDSVPPAEPTPTTPTPIPDQVLPEASAEMPSQTLATTLLLLLWQLVTVQYAPSELSVGVAFLPEGVFVFDSVGSNILSPSQLAPTVEEGLMRLVSERAKGAYKVLVGHEERYADLLELAKIEPLPALPEEALCVPPVSMATATPSRFEQLLRRWKKAIDGHVEVRRLCDSRLDVEGVRCVLQLTSGLQPPGGFIGRLCVGSNEFFPFQVNVEEAIEAYLLAMARRVGDDHHEKQQMFRRALARFATLGR